MDDKQTAFITNDAVVTGILLGILALVFYTASSKKNGWVKFYKIVPSILLCYFIPALLNTFNIINGEKSALYTIASRYFLPASLVLLTLGIDIPALRRLGGKSTIMFFAGTIGVMVGGPLALFIVGSINESVLLYKDEEAWKGLATIAGSWIGGGANQAAMLEVFGASKDLFSQVVVVDVMVGYLWTGILLYGSQHNEKINKWLGANSAAITELENKMEAIDNNRAVTKRGTREWILLLGAAFGLTAVSHFGADIIAPWFTKNYPASANYSLTSGFFWLVIIATTLGLIFSFTKARKLEQYGASDLGSVFLYFLVATIGMQMDLKAVLTSPTLFVIALIWIIIHIAILLVVAKWIKAPFFFVAVGSQANIGGAASAPIVAAAFNKYLAPVGVLLAILGYAVGTYGGYLCGLSLKYVSELLR
ncbi:DUF819 domain-containing protein [Aridibaculum aurantiacum]|uniref:DUF819 family protein n=1 Tax=Aridibaculum aurantiacum TaxID=2810307 RepID=UPI001A972BC0|nr:DUF819 family protein [Aridibaculum aurantiacum]